MKRSLEQIMQICINLNILECKLALRDIFGYDVSGINLNILECKFLIATTYHLYKNTY